MKIENGRKCDARMTPGANGQELRMHSRGKSGRGLRKHTVDDATNPHKNPKQILTCSSILVNAWPESTPIGGYLSNVFSRVVT